MERGKQSKENRGRQLQSSFTLLEHFLKSIFYMLYTISKLKKSKIQHFKPCTIWSWNEKDMAFGRQLHQAEGQFRTLRNWNFNVRNLKWMAAVKLRWSPAFEVDFENCKLGSQRAKVDFNLRKWILSCEINLRNFRKSPCNVRNWDIYADSFSSDIFCV